MAAKRTITAYISVVLKPLTTLDNSVFTTILLVPANTGAHGPQARAPMY